MGWVVWFVTLCSAVVVQLAVTAFGVSGDRSRERRVRRGPDGDTNHVARPCDRSARKRRGMRGSGPYHASAASGSPCHRHKQGGPPVYVFRVSRATRSRCRSLRGETPPWARYHGGRRGAPRVNGRRLITPLTGPVTDHTTHIGTVLKGGRCVPSVPTPAEPSSRRSVPRRSRHSPAVVRLRAESHCASRRLPETRVSSVTKRSNAPDGRAVRSVSRCWRCRPHRPT